jgi:hypothetical protein
MNMLVHGLKTEENLTATENGMLALRSTTDDLVDLFGAIGALRERSEGEIISKFTKAFSADKLLANKMIFYARDIREGGLGERNTPKIIWKYMANVYPDVMAKNIHLIPYFGRWDDMYVFVDTPIEGVAFALIRKQFEMDMTNLRAGKPISIMGKWLKSTNASSKETVRLGNITAKALGLTQRQYRKAVSSLRKEIEVLERKMSSKEWDKINYSTVPSVAMNRYRNAFKRNDEYRFSAYLESVSKGEAKINANTLFPYDIVEKYLYNTNNYRYIPTMTDTVLEEQWRALPNYIDSNENILVMADVSGSMYGRPMATSIGLAIYFGERNIGTFHNMFMTFSGKPSLQEIKGSNLFEKITNLSKAEWQMNTNIEAAFNKILRVAVENNVPASDIPKALIVISDMEFDHCAKMSKDFYATMRSYFAQHGYELPNIVFWNVNSRNDVYHANSQYVGVQLVSGQSASTFKNILMNMGKTPYEAMLDVLNSEAYKDVVV